MKSILKITTMLAVAMILSASGRKDNPADNFVSPPASMTIGVYWYWLSGNISKDGVVKDLHAMKQAGINAVFIGNIGGNDRVKLFTDEWWDILHTAMKTAGELDIEVGMFNCPGWSHSGGPWIKAEQSMRHLVASETRVTGGAKVNVKLPVPQQPTQYKDWTTQFIDHEDKPSPYFQDVKVLAVPVPEDYRFNLFDTKGAKVTASGMRPVEGLDAQSSASFDRPAYGLPATSPLAAKYVAPKGQESSVTLRLPNPQDARSLSIYTASHCRGEGELQAKVNGEFVSIAKYPLYRVYPIPSVGYTPYAPVVTGFEKVTSDEYRIVFRNIERDAAIGRITLSSTAALDKYPEKSLARMHQSGGPAYTEYKWTSTLRAPGLNDPATALDPAQAIDITDRMQPDGTLTWDAPEGEWLVLRTGMVPNEVFNSPTSPEGAGWEVDKLNPEHYQYHFDRFLGEILRRIPAEDRKTFRVTIMDSWEKGAQTFTDGFIDTMKVHYGYDPTPFLPVLTGHLVGSPEQSDRFLWDVRRLSAEMAGNNLLSNFNAITHKQGIETWIENYGDWGFPGEFLLYGKNTDRVGGEFWVGGDKRYIDDAASCAHIYNKPHVYAEAFTRTKGGGYLHHPYSLKRDGDGAFAAGLTRCILHVYIQQPNEALPGVDAWYGTEFNRNNTWFEQSDLFMTYLKRCGMMLEQGLPVSDVAYFIGEDVPVNSGPFGLKPQNAKYGVTIPVLPQGYHADYVNSDIIINAMSVKDGRIVLPHGISYRILVLPPFETMRPEVLKSIERLVADGATVLGEAPVRSPSLRNYPSADGELNELAAKMWGDKTANRRNYGKGLILSGITIEEALAAIHVAPDVKQDSDNIVYNHRVTADRDIYFLANLSDKPLQVSPEFRVTGKQPELWNPVNGEMRPLPAFGKKAASTVVPLQFEPYESMFIVFRKNGKPTTNDLAANFPEFKVLTGITTPWTVKFDSDKIKRGPAEPVIFNTLEDWSKNSDERIRYYSGTAVYTNTFILSAKDKKISLDLGQVSVMAKVKINGKYAGGVWTPPYRIDITSFVKKGENNIEIEVVNTWINRLIGDQRLPKEKRIVTSINSPAKADSPLAVSGLLGPVRIVEN
jgi:hypothetical protein